MIVTFFMINSAKEVARYSLQMGLSKIGHLNEDVNVVSTFQYGSGRYVAIESEDVLDHDTIESIDKRLANYGDCELVASTDQLYLMHTFAKEGAPDSKYRLWFDRATYR